MGTGILAACLCLALGQNPGDVTYANFRNLSIPVNVPAALQPEIRELLLYASSDQGRGWKQVAGPITPDKKGFAFYAPADGVYWLRVVKVDRQGKQDPDDKGIMTGPPDQKLAIDTLKPIVRSIQTLRHGDEVHVTWDVQEDNPDLGKDGMQLEYQVKDSSDAWKPIPFTPGLKGKAQFAPGNTQPLVVRLTIRDLAGNQSFGIAEVSGTVSAAGFTKPNNGSTPVLPSELTVPERKTLTTEGTKPGPIDIDKKLPPESPKREIPPLPGGMIPPPPGGLINPPGGLINPPPPQGGVIPPPTSVAKEQPGDKVIADSRFPPPPVEQPKPPIAREGPGVLPNETPIDTKSIANSAPARKPLPPIQYVNQHQIMLEYELRRVGPSGIGGIELWLTRDDGETWEPYAADEDVQAGALNNRQKRKFDLRDASDRPFADGVYGLTLVVKNRAGLGKKPRPGDIPEIRIEIDTTLPFAQMFQPVADPQHPEQVLLKWTAEDKNLAPAPISLEFAEKADGPWLPIGTDLENSGRFSWKTGPAVPVQVFLRMRVRDKAGNERILVTPQAQFIDFTEPEGALIGVQPQGKAP